MGEKFNTPEEERAYQLGKLDGMLYYQQNIIRNIKNDYEKIYKKKQEFENPAKN